MSKIKIYKASAGSGKTYTLVFEYVRELLTAQSNDYYRHILAVTFTKDATGEMKDRILAELYGLSFATDDSAEFMVSMRKTLKENGQLMTEQQIQNKAGQILQALLCNYSQLNITTIDSFFQKVLRNLAREFGYCSKFNLEMNINKVLQEAVHAVIEKANCNKQVLEWLITYIECKMENDSNWRVEHDIFNFSRCIYNEFFQENEKQMRRQLAENPHMFTQISKQQQKTQGKCKQIFKRLMQKTNDILNQHSLTENDFGNSKYGLRFIAKLARGDISASVSLYVTKCIENITFWGKTSHSRKVEIEALAAEELRPILIRCIKTQMIYKTSQMITGNLYQLGLIWDICKEIEEQNVENNRFMLPDTAIFLNEMIDSSDAPFIYEKLGVDIRHVMIDEFQDTSRVQWRNFKALLSNIIANDDFSLMVGDIKQSIYRWRNGDWRILNNIGNELQAVVKTLEYNYRSEKTVIDFNNNLFIAVSRLMNQLYSIRFGDISRSPFLSAYDEKNIRQKTLKTIKAGYVSVDFISDREDGLSYSTLMSEAVFMQLKKLHKAGIPVGDICILTRTNRDIVTLADYLLSQVDEYPEMAKDDYLSVVSDEAFQLQSSQAIQTLIKALRMIAYPANPIYETCFSFRHWSIAQLNRMPLFELISYLYCQLGLEQISGQSAYLFAFYDYITKYLNEKSTDLLAFLRYWDEELKDKPVPTSTGVSGIRAMTIHKSKGLQFPTVIIPYCDWAINPKCNETIVWCGPKVGWYDIALLPVAYVNGMANTIFAREYEIETSQSWLDNLNIMYVGFTRAKQNLIVFAKYKKSLTDINQITSVSDLLQLTVPHLFGHYDETIRHYESSPFVDHPLPLTIYNLPLTPNPLRQTPPLREISFSSNIFQSDKSLFKQSNKSREFIHPEADYHSVYGNIMHSLFEQITNFDDIEKAIDNMIAEGLLRSDEKAKYVKKIRSAIYESQVDHWFSGQYHSYQEYSIITEEKGEIVNKRPDRVLFSDDETLVIDYKFGKEHYPKYKKQVKQYMNLLKTMYYPYVKGYLWYVEERLVVEVI